jgi:hypothetical protein
MWRALLKPIMRPIARRKLHSISVERGYIAEAIRREKLGHRRTSDLIQMARDYQMLAMKWERWL